MHRGKRGVRSFGNVIQSPVQTIDIEVNEKVPWSDATHICESLASEGVADIDGTICGDGPAPGVIGSCTQGEGIELLKTGGAEERKIQLGRSVLFIKNEAQRVFFRNEVI